MRFLAAMCVLAAIVVARANAAEESTLPDIIQSLRHGDREARSQALSEKKYHCPACRPVVPTLVEVFREGGAELRKSALERLAEVGPVAEEAVPLLKEALRSGNAADLPLVTESLWRIEKHCLVIQQHIGFVTIAIKKKISTNILIICYSWYSAGNKKPGKNLCRHFCQNNFLLIS